MKTRVVIRGGRNGEGRPDRSGGIRMKARSFCSGRAKKCTLPEMFVPLTRSAAERSDHWERSRSVCKVKCSRTSCSGLASEAHRARFCEAGIPREQELW